MAPALTIAPREPHSVESALDDDKPLSARRRALASVDNLATHMDDDMGLQNQPSLAKDSQEMEQILVDLGNSDLGQTDLLQAIKTLETGGDPLSTGDTDAIFPLSGFDLPEPADSEGDAAEDKIKTAQVRLERRCAFLHRRLRILQARALGKRISEEAAQTFEKCTRGARKDGGGRPIGLKTFLKTVETTAALQASAQSRTVVGPKYYNPGTSKGDASKSASIGIPPGTLSGLEDTSGALRTHMSIVKHELDSDATASSSGAESNDEAVTYSNPHQQHMPIDKRALWSYQRERASIASRWCWLQAQVQELEYKIRQHNDLHKQVRDAKGPVEFEGEPVGYQGSLPGSVPAPYQSTIAPSEPADNDPATETCARVRPLRRDTFKKRKLLQMHNLHIATTKAAKPADIKCSCQQPAESCAVCTGRLEPAQPAPPLSTQHKQQRVAAVDPAYHPVLSTIKDVSGSSHMSAISSRAWFRARSSRGRPAPGKPPGLAPARRLCTRLKRGRPPLTRKIRERERDDETSASGHERSRGRSSTESRGWRRQSYDIDNIVIPQSVAANTRPEILTYKEIITPKWRVMEIPETPLNNGIMKSNRMSIESEEEDVSDPAVAARHRRAETRERSRYVRKSRARRATHTHDHQHDTLDAPPPSPPAPPAPPDPPPPPHVHETVRPYTPRQFPLAEEAYAGMLAAMPAGYRPDAAPAGYRADTAPVSYRADAAPEPEPALSPHGESRSSSALSGASPLAFEGDDPDDVEWDPSAERVDRRKSAFR